MWILRTDTLYKYDTTTHEEDKLCLSPEGYIFIWPSAFPPAAHHMMSVCVSLSFTGSPASASLQLSDSAHYLFYLFYFFAVHHYCCCYVLKIKDKKRKTAWIKTNNINKGSLQNTDIIFFFNIWVIAHRDPMTQSQRCSCSFPAEGSTDCKHHTKIKLVLWLAVTRRCEGLLITAQMKTTSFVSNNMVVIQTPTNCLLTVL